MACNDVARAIAIDVGNEHLPERTICILFNCFALSVAISGETVAVGAPGDLGTGLASGAIYVFDYDGVDWNPLPKLSVTGSGGDCIGRSVTMEGNTVCAGAPDFGSFIGAVYCFDLAGTDCNGNEVCDDEDISAGTSVDSDGNGVPDECEPPFIRGDVNADATFTALADALFLLSFGFQGGTAPSCEDAADFDDDGTLGPLVDGFGILSFGFAGGPPPALPGLTCGVDPTEPDLSCAFYGFCP